MGQQGGRNGSMLPPGLNPQSRGGGQNFPQGIGPPGGGSSVFGFDGARRFGAGFGKAEYVTCLVVSALVPVALSIGVEPGYVVAFAAACELTNLETMRTSERMMSMS